MLLKKLSVGQLMEYLLFNLTSVVIFALLMFLLKNENRRRIRTVDGKQRDLDGGHDLLEYTSGSVPVIVLVVQVQRDEQYRK